MINSYDIFIQLHYRYGCHFKDSLLSVYLQTALNHSRLRIRINNLYIITKSVESSSHSVQIIPVYRLIRRLIILVSIKNIWNYLHGFLIFRERFYYMRTRGSYCSNKNSCMTKKRGQVRLCYLQLIGIYFFIID